MTKPTIWGIVILMSIALLGIIGLQTYWISSALHLSEQQFDKQIDIALKEVASRMKDEDDNRIIEQTKSLERDILDDIITPDSLNLSNVIHTEGDVCQCKTCVKKRIERQNSLLRGKLLDKNEKRALVERINISKLNQILEEVFQGLNVQLKYDYEVFDNEERSIIKNGVFQIADSNEQFTPQAISQGERVVALEKPNRRSYQQHLFQDRGIEAAGSLLVTFPNKTSYIWQSVWWALFAAIFFTSIILFCFTYAVRTIIEQKKLSEIKADFINNMTHEFKTPIATISLAADSITNPMIISQKEKIERFANIIKQENRRMNSQVEKVLQMALLDKKDFQLKASEINMHDIISQAVNNINLQVEKKGGKASTNLQANNHIVTGDVTHLTNVIHNLLDNANKYTPETPEIIVSTRDVPNGIEISVKDNGIGLSKDDRKRIFDKFYRVHTGNLHDVKGFGLGLSYVKAIMVAHQGQIDVKSDLGKGSEFILFLPYYRSQQT